MSRIEPGGTMEHDDPRRHTTDAPSLAIRLANARRALDRERAMVSYFREHPVRYPWGARMAVSTERLQALTARVRDLVLALSAVRPWSPALRPGELGPRSGWPRCGARTRTGRPCVAPLAVVNGRPRARCRMHGGLSTGPRGMHNDAP